MIFYAFLKFFQNQINAIVKYVCFCKKNKKTSIKRSKNTVFPCTEMDCIKTQHV